MKSKWHCLWRQQAVIGLMCGVLLQAQGAQFKSNKTVPEGTLAGKSGFAATAGSNTRTSSQDSDDPRVSSLSTFLRAQVQSVDSAKSESQWKLSRESAQFEVLKRLEKETPGFNIRFRENNTPMWVGGELAGGSNTGLDPLIAAVQTAGNWLSANSDLFQVADFENEFKLVATSSDNLGGYQLIYQQIYKDLDVYLCELSAHINADGDLTGISATTIPGPRALPVIPAITPEEARLRTTLVNPILARGQIQDPKLVVFGAFEYEPALCWIFDTQVGATMRWRNVVDAQTGDVIEQYNITKTASVAGSGADGNGVTRNLSVWEQAGTYHLVDASKQMFDASSNPPLQGRGVIAIYDGNNKDVIDPQFSAGLVRSSSPTSGWLPDGIGAAWGLSETYDYFLEKHQRNSLDGQGGTIRAIVRYKQDEPNAFFIGETTTMVFGDLQPKLIDISAHELTHGVTDATGNGGVLEYRFQPGALNESMSDIFAELVELYATGQNDWKLFLAFPQGDRQIRDFINPGVITNGGRPFPSKMSEFWELNANEDSGGVHINSSINNHCFYLLAAGMDGAIGNEDAGKIFYRALTTYMRKQSQFIDMRIGAVQSAIDIFGAESVQVQKTREAYDLVEIFDAPPAPKPTPVPILDGDDAALFFRYDPIFDVWLIGRRELAQGDSAIGVLADTLQEPMVQRTSVTGDGSIAVFVTATNDLGFMNTETGAVSFAGLAGQIHSVAMSPSGLRYAAVLRDPFSGEPEDYINLIDLETQQEISVNLVAPTQDGDPLDIIAYADAIDFLPDGSGIVYDALARIPIEGYGLLEAWTLYTMDLETQTITMLIDLDEGFDFGNPNLGHSHPNLITFEVINRETSISEVYVADFASGAQQLIFTQPEPNLLGVPYFNGNDTAIIFSSRDNSTGTRGSLVEQFFDPADLSLVGDPILWLSDGVFGTIYRRGEFTTENQLPQVAITSPTNGTALKAPASFSIQATASDPDGQIARVEFYFGSQKVAEDNEAPYSITVENMPAQNLRLFVRAFDNFGAAGDSAVVEISVEEENVEPGPGPEIAGRRINGGLFELTIPTSQNGDIFRFDASGDLKTWVPVSTLTHTGTGVRFVDPDSATIPTRFYRAVKQ